MTHPICSSQERWGRDSFPQSISNFRRKLQMLILYSFILCFVCITSAQHAVLNGDEMAMEYVRSDKHTQRLICFRMNFFLPKKNIFSSVHQTSILKISELLPKWQIEKPNTRRRFISIAFQSQVICSYFRANDLLKCSHCWYGIRTVERDATSRNFPLFHGAVSSTCLIMVASPLDLTLIICILLWLLFAAYANYGVCYMTWHRLWRVTGGKFIFVLLIQWRKMPFNSIVCVPTLFCPASSFCWWSRHHVLHTCRIDVDVDLGYI